MIKGDGMVQIFLAAAVSAICFAAWYLFSKKALGLDGFQRELYGACADTFGFLGYSSLFFIIFFLVCKIKGG
jgi:hypothetical protein